MFGCVSFAVRCHHRRWRHERGGLIVVVGLSFRTEYSALIRYRMPRSQLVSLISPSVYLPYTAWTLEAGRGMFCHRLSGSISTPRPSIAARLLSSDCSVPCPAPFPCPASPACCDEPSFPTLEAIRSAGDRCFGAVAVDSPPGLLVLEQQNARLWHPADRPVLAHLHLAGGNVSLVPGDSNRLAAPGRKGRIDESARRPRQEDRG